MLFWLLFKFAMFEIISWPSDYLYLLKHGRILSMSLYVLFRFTIVIKQLQNRICRQERRIVLLSKFCFLEKAYWILSEVKTKLNNSLSGNRCEKRLGTVVKYTYSKHTHVKLLMIQCVCTVFKDSYTCSQTFTKQKKLKWTTWKMKEIFLINKEFIICLFFSEVVFWVNLLVSTWPLHVMSYGCRISQR